MFDRSIRYADMPAEQRLINLNLATNTPDRRKRPTWRFAFEMVGMGAAAWAVFITGLWLVS